MSDNGVGIAPAMLARIFDPFFTTKPVGRGTGLGLAVSHGIVTALGSRIEVESTPGRGSRFTVYLPIGVGAETVAPPPSVQVRSVVSTRRPRVLVIDDERTLRTTLAGLMEDSYEVVLAESGAAAFRILEGDRELDAILCDLMMPDISGMQVHAWVQREAPALLPSLGSRTPPVWGAARRLTGSAPLPPTDRAPCPSPRGRSYEQNG